MAAEAERRPKVSVGARVAHEPTIGPPRVKRDRRRYLALLAIGLSAIVTIAWGAVLAWGAGRLLAWALF
jgi:hypothetical protein